MNCERFKEHLLDFLYDELPEVETSEMIGHMTTCASCHAETNELKLVRNEMAEWKDPETRNFPIVLPYDSPWAAVKRLFVPRPWTGRNALTFAVAACALLLTGLSILGTQIEISRNGLFFRTDLLRRPAVTAPASPMAASNGASFQPVSLDVVSRMIQQSEGRQRQMLRAEEARLVDQLTSSYRTQLTALAKNMDNKHKVDLVSVYDNLEQQRLADLQRIRMTFSSLDARASQQAQQTQQLVDFIQKASYSPK